MYQVFVQLDLDTRENMSERNRHKYQLVLFQMKCYKTYRNDSTGLHFDTPTATFAHSLSTKSLKKKRCKHPYIQANCHPNMSNCLGFNL